MKNRIENCIETSMNNFEKILKDDALLLIIEQVTSLMIEAFNNDHKVLLCGNGGSASDAQHIAAELSGRFYIDRRPLYAEALHVNSSFMTAVANDYGYEETYARMVEATGRKGDIFIPQNFISRKNNKRLTFKKTMSEPYSLGMTDGAYHNVLKVKLEKNSSGDIKNATKEMFDHTIYKKKYSSRDQRLQNEFKKVAFEKKILPGLKKLITCRIGKDFLEKNQQLL